MVNTDNCPLLVPNELNPPLNPTLVTDGAGLGQVRSFIERTSHSDSFAGFGLDTETNVVPSFFRRRARTIQLGDFNEQYVIDLWAFADYNTQRLIDEQGNYGKQLGTGLREVADTLRPVFDTNQVMKVGFNLEFEYIVSKWCLGIRLWHLYCAYYAEKVLTAGVIHPDSPLLSMRNTFARYFGLQISKELQESFDFSPDKPCVPLTQNQIIYAALDTRLPLALRLQQIPELKKARLTKVARIEFDAIPAFGDLHLNGLKCGNAEWRAIYNNTAEQHLANIIRLDTFFIPVVGRKDAIDTTTRDQLAAKWGALGDEGEPEKAIKLAMREVRDSAQRAALRAQWKAAVEERKARRADARAAYYVERKRINEALKIVPGCQGDALINYSSNKQLKEALWKMKGFNARNLPNTDDGTLKKLAQRPVIAALRDYRTTEKMLGTYGLAWVTPWKTKACGDEGWVDPDTGRIHSAFKQIGADTGRVASTAPNVENLPHDDRYRAAFIADSPDEQEPEGYVIGTADMSGAELRIMADAANAKSWIDAFAKKWDVHSWCAEILYPAEWPQEKLPDCAYFTKDHKKCECPLHEVRRSGCKTLNFGLPYGLGVRSFAEQIGKPEEVAADLIEKHHAEFPDIWDALERWGKEAITNMEARTLFDRRRIFTRPSYEDATERANERSLKKHKCNASSEDITSQLAQMYKSIERQGKNMKIQGTNADIIKLAMGCGFDKDGKPYLWHVMEPQYQAKVLNVVHDELVHQWPKRFGEAPLEAIADAFKRAAAERMKHVVMETEGRIANRWQK